MRRDACSETGAEERPDWCAPHHKNGRIGLQGKAELRLATRTRKPLVLLVFLLLCRRDASADIWIPSEDSPPPARTVTATGSGESYESETNISACGNARVSAWVNLRSKCTASERLIKFSGVPDENGNAASLRDETCICKQDTVTFGWTCKVTAEGVCQKSNSEKIFLADLGIGNTPGAEGESREEACKTAAAGAAVFVDAFCADRNGTSGKPQTYDCDCLPLPKKWSSGVKPIHKWRCVGYALLGCSYKSP